MDEAIGRRVHALMWERRVTNRSMAPHLGMDESGLGRRLRGERGWSAEQVWSAASYLNVPIATIYGGDTVTTPTPGGVGPAGIEPTTSTV
ncbi:helix-turn-helix domain-containing protein [uncultured Microbacterium sp.]|uniref:helix-turn-helix domain-containing protein n=1 Tax=uncultured Microbacterium sp. TaxID=191216 RepID=UPI00345BFCD5